MPEIVDLVSSGPLGPFPDVAPGGSPDIEILAARRAFATAQTLLFGEPVAPPQAMTVGWHDSSVSTESGSFAVVQINAGLEDYVGEVVRVVLGDRVVFAYVLDEADVPVQLSLARRAFIGLTRPTFEAVHASVAVVDG